MQRVLAAVRVTYMRLLIDVFETSPLSRRVHRCPTGQAHTTHNTPQEQKPTNVWCAWSDAENPYLDIVKEHAQTEPNVLCGKHEVATVAQIRIHCGSQRQAMLYRVDDIGPQHHVYSRAIWYGERACVRTPGALQ